jgi:hypothetical protein
MDDDRGIIPARGITHPAPVPVTFQHCLIVGVQLAAGENMLLNGVHEWAEQLARSTNPAGQCGVKAFMRTTPIHSIQRPAFRSEAGLL